MANVTHITSTKDGLSLKVFRGDRAVLLAFDLDDHLTQDFAGFAIKCTTPDGKSDFLLNRLNFTQQITTATTPEQREWTPSDQAPFQKFHWVQFPAHVQPGEYTYAVTAMYCQPQGGLKAGPSTEASIDLIPGQTDYSNFELGFTRGYISSQAYAEEFKNAAFRPEPKTIDYDTAPYEQQYQWLGAHAREMVFRFLKEAQGDPGITLDVFAYDLDEPDVIRCLEDFGGRLRAFLDNAPLHTHAGALEIDALAALQKSAGADNVKVGHFHRFAHNKVLIQKRDGKAIKVLTGSANFSVRGLYVQANNVLIFDDAGVADYYERAFTEAFDDMAGFAKSDIAAQWFEIKTPGVPQFDVAFSPHTSATVSLDKVVQAINGAQSSVLFAVMELEGGGPVLEALRALPARKEIFSYGMTQSEKGGLTIYKPGQAGGIIVPFSFLKSKVPQAFREEYSGGMGQVIHHKFVVVDFNDVSPVVFAGSSNLAAGGEEANGDNLLAIYNSNVVTAYALEAIRLVDHYHFRAAWQAATDDKPLVLSCDSSENAWWKPYYNPDDIRCHQRSLFIR